MPSHVYTIGEFVTEISALGTADTYPYASLSGASTNSCRLVSIDGHTGAIEFVRNGATRVGKISQSAVAKLVSALATGKAIEINALYGGSGNFRSALEALVVRTPHVFLCKIDGKKHFYRDVSRAHPIGTIEITENPTVEIFAGTVTQEKRSEDELNLIVGMRSPESPYGVVTILDDDDYSYQVLCVNESKHSTGIRTISKPLLKEWIEAVKIAPDKGAESIRDDLTGKSEIDKFEYGNAGVLIKLAKMATGQLEHTIVDVSSYWHRRMGRSERVVITGVDRLGVALKVFAEKRYEAEWQDKTRKDGYQNIYDMAGMTPEQISAGSLDDFYNDFLLKIWAFKNGGSRRYGQLDEAGRKAYRQFVVDLKTQLKSFDSYFPPDPKCPDGMGVGVLTELMMRFWPKSCCNYNASLIHEALVTLHMAEGDFVWPKTPSVYQDFMGKCATILLKMEQMKLPRRSDPGNDEPPDYITVNEFLWFVREYKDLIQEEVMSKKMKTDAPTKYDEGKRKPLEFKSDSKDDELLMRLLAALRAKPFAILAGHSGTGKSRYVKKLAYMTCNMDELRNENQLPGNYLLLQVKPNWHDSTELLGFRNAMDGDRYQKTKLIEFLFRAYQFKDTPFFLCLDEMNLAPVEQYFAEFLSSMESAEPVPLNDITVKDDNLFDLGCEWKAAYDYLAANGFSIPKNLFIVGTVNMDETTNQFSRKVLDRAFTIEMTDVDFKNYGHVTQPSYADTIEEEKIQALLNGEKFVDKLDDEDVAEGAPLVKVQKALEPTAFAVAYRFANEYTLLKRAIACFDKDSTMKLDALDQAVLMKILPRVAGEKDYIEKVYGKNDNEGLRKALEGKSVSLKKIAEIMKRANDMNAQYITFWP